MPIIAERLDSTRYAGSFAPLQHVDLAAFEAVVPFGLPDYAVLAAHPDMEGRRFLRPSDQIAALCNDKLALARFLAGAGFQRHVPTVGYAGAVPYPFVRRPRRDEFGRRARILLGPSDDIEPGPDDFDVFDQAYVRGADEYVLHAIRHQGRVRFAWVLLHRMAGPDLVRGHANAPIRSEEIDPRPALAAFAPMLEALDYCGTCSIDFKMAGDVPQLLEINPRIGGSLTLGINAYLDAYLDCLTP